MSRKIHIALVSVQKIVLAKVGPYLDRGIVEWWRENHSEIRSDSGDFGRRMFKGIFLREQVFVCLYVCAF